MNVSQKKLCIKLYYINDYMKMHGLKYIKNLSLCQDNIAAEVIYFCTNENVTDSHLYVIQVIYDQQY